MDASVTGADSRPTSAWPPFVALGLAVAEVGVLFGLFVVTVAGLLVLGRSCAGAVAETGYAESAWRPLAAFGLLFVGLGVGLWTAGAVPGLTPRSALRAPLTDRVAFRGAAVVLAGALLGLSGLVGTRRRNRPAS